MKKRKKKLTKHPRRDNLNKIPYYPTATTIYINIKDRLDCSSRFIQPSRRVLFRVYISQEDGSSFCCQPTYQISHFLFFIVRPVLKIITTNISKYKRAAILYNGSSIKTLCRCDNERNNHFPFDLVYLDAQQHKTLKDENSWKRRIRLIVVVLAVQNMNRSLFGTRIQEPSHHVQATFPYFFSVESF